jgi:predicted TIM-barrel fold metal-dependent hydrolase
MNEDFSAPPGRAVDVHTHAFPDFLAPRAIARLQEKGKTLARLDGTVEALLSSMDRAGVSRSVVCSVATGLDQFDAILNWSRQIAGRRIIPFPSLHPRSPGSGEEIRRVAEAGFSGIKLHPEYQDFFIDDPSLADFYGEADEAGLIILFHAGYDIGFPDSDRSSPGRIAQVRASFPRLRIIASHLGGFRQWDEVGRTLLGTDVYLDTSYVFGHIPRDLLLEIIRGHRPDRILFGSDSPWAGQGETLEEIGTLGLDPEIEGLIRSGNAMELLGL